MRTILPSALVGAVLGLTGTALALDTSGQLSVGARVMGIAAVSGALDAQDNLSDVLGVGPSFGIEFGYTPTRQITVRGGFDYGWLKVDEAERPSPELEPALNWPVAFLEGTFNFASLMPESAVNPFASIGVGLYPWKFTDDGVTGDPVVLADNEEFKKTSLGFSFGAGLEGFPLSAAPGLALFGHALYHYVLMEDEDAFGVGFENQGFVTFGGGLRYYFPIGT